MRFSTTPSARQIDLGLTILRATTGLIFLAHGAQKLFVFGFAGVTGAFTQMGVPLPGIAGPATALVEFFGGLALIAGLLTRLASVGLSITMLGAIFLVHLSAGFFAPQGIEFPLALVGAAATLAITGAGRYSLDALLGSRHSKASESAQREPLRRAA
jgi:putative oxidoreductase